MNLPVGGFTFSTILLFLHLESPKREKLSAFAQIKRLDPIGILFFVPSITCLILALQWGGTTYSWSAPRIIGLLVAFGVLFIAFIVTETLMPETAMAPPRVVLNRSIAGSMLFTFLLSGGLMSIVYYLTIWFQTVKEDSAMHAGISTIPLVVSLVVMSIFSGGFTQKIGYYVPAMLLSPVLCSTGAGLLSTLTRSSGHSAWIGYQVLFGFGVGCGFQTSNLASQTVLPRADVPLGMALMFFMQQIGGSIFVAVSQNIFSSKLVRSLSGTAGLDTKAIVNTGATALRSIVPSDQLEVVLRAYNHALTDVFILATILSACMILGALAVEWRRIKAESKSDEDSESLDTKLDDPKSKETAQA